MKKLCILTMTFILGFNVSVVCAQQTGGGQKTPPVCDICKIDRYEHKYEIDARPGYTEATVRLDGSSIKGQAVNFKKSDRVRVILTHMNPFLYEYTVKINSTPVAEVAPSLFFAQFSTFLAEAIKSAGDKQALLSLTDDAPAEPVGTSLKLDSAPSWPTKCQSSNDAKEAHDYLVARYGELQKLESRGKGEPQFLKRYKAVSEAFQKADADYETTLAKVSDQFIQCDQLCSAIQSFQQTINTLAATSFNGKNSFADEIAALQEEGQGYQNIADEIIALTAEFKTSYPDCQPKLKGFNHVDALSKYATAFKTKFAARYLTPLDNQAQKKREQFDSLNRAIAFVIEHQEVLLRQEIEIGKFAVPTDVAVTVERRPTELLSKFKASEAAAFSRSLNFNDGSNTIADLAAFALAASEDKEKKSQAAAGNTSAPAQATERAKLNFGGGARFSLSAGVVVSKLEKREFQPVLGIARDRNGNATGGDALVSVAGFKESAGRRISPLLMLNTRIWQNEKRGLHGSFGVTGKHDSTGTSVEYFFGPSFSFLENRVFFTVGPYVGKQQRLAGDLFLNAPVPSDKTVPVRNEYRSKIGASFTYKIK